MTLPAPRTPGTYRVAVACLGNICRSPMAHVVLVDLVRQAGLDDRVEVVSAVPDEVRGVGVLLRSWWGFAQETAGWSRIAAGFAGVLAIVVGAGVATRWLARHQPVVGAADGRFARAVVGLRVLAETSLALPLAGCETSFDA